MCFLTDPGDYMVDPFGGSCVTGAVAAALERKWTCCKLSEEYLSGEKARFVPEVQPLDKRRDVTYSIAPPCSQLVNEAEIPLFEDGGAKRPASLTKKPKAASEPTVKAPLSAS